MKESDGLLKKKLDTDVLDQILESIGDTGKKQLNALFLICFVVVLYSATHVSYVFTAFNGDYRCFVPGCDGENPVYNAPWVRDAIPESDDSSKLRKCEMFHLRDNGHSYDNCTMAQFDRNETIKCSSFVFQDNENYIAKEFNLLCEENVWKLTLVGTINTIGMFFGLLITGIVSDKYGRKFVLIVGMAACGITGFIKAFSPSYNFFLTCEFFEAVFASGTYGSGFILGVELVTPKKRVLTGCLSCTCYAIGEVLLAIVAMSVKDWKKIIFILYIPCILLIFLYKAIPESIRWHLSKGELEQTKKILRNFARANGKTISEDALTKLKEVVKDRQENSENTMSFVELLKSVPLFFRFLNCSFCWLTCAFLFYGLTLNSVTLSSNSYMDFIYISLTEIPAYWAATYLVEKIGRKYSIFGSFALTAISCFGFLLLSEGSYWAHLIVYCLGKFGATSAFILIYVIASEVFPTSLRNTTMGVCSMIGRVGSVTSPQVPLLGQLWQPLPLLLFGALAAVAGCTSLFFPETLNIKLPDTIEEAENIGKRSHIRVETVNL